MTGHLPQTDSTGLPTHLWRLAQFTRDKVKESKARGELVETIETFVRRKIAKFNYTVGGNISLEWSYEFVQKPEWHWRHQSQFVETAITPSACFQECVKLLTPNDSQNTSPRASDLDRFVRVIATESRDQCPDEKLVECIARFMSDLSNAPVEIRVSAWVEGLWLKDESIRVGSFVLRRPTAHDLVNERPLSIALGSAFDLTPASNPPAIAEFTVTGTSAIVAQDEVASFMGALRLYRLGAVRDVGYSISPDSLTRFGGTHGSSQRLFASDRFALGSDESDSLLRFVSRVKPLLPTLLADDTSPRKPADLGFVRFSDAVLKLGDVEGRITAAITCLEALFLKSRERSELAHKLSLRVACLLRLLKLNPIEVQTQVHQAYDIRSTYIHGGQAEQERLRDAQDLCRKVLEYARLCTVIFLQLKDHTDKDEFLSKLDRALLEPKSLERIEKQLKELTIPQ